MDALPYNKLFETLGSRIKAMRLSKGLKQKIVADACEIHRGNYSEIESGKRHVSLRTLFKIAYALEEPIASFFEDSIFITCFNNQEK